MLNFYSLCSLYRPTPATKPHLKAVTLRASHLFFRFFYAARLMVSCPDQPLAGINARLKRLGEKQRQALLLSLALLTAVLLALVALSREAYAQVDVSKFKTASDQIVKAIQSISGPAVFLLLAAGLGLLLWGGISDTIRIRALRIVFFAVVGAGALFLFAQPLGDFIVGTFQPAA
ncbi:MAG TPA: TrbC/VirB2 family protein [Chloroflexia bacterium]|nr:TrbC/VirB2 family protein [Chloroflexia bacterium]